MAVYLPGEWHGVGGRQSVHWEMEAEPRAQPADRCDEGKRRGPNKYDVNLGGDTVETIVVDGTEHPARMIRRYR